MRPFFHTLLFFCVLPYAYAEPSQRCSSIDLRPGLGAPREQGPTEWCYAHVAADLVSQKIGQRVSPFDLAARVLLGDKRKLRDLARSQPDVFAHFAKSRETDEDIYKMPRMLSDKGLYQLAGWDDAAILAANLGPLCPDERLPDGEAAYYGYLSELEDYRKCALAGCASDLARKPLLGVITDRAANTAAYQLLAWIDARCGVRIPVKEALLPLVLKFGDNLIEYRAQVKKKKVNPKSARARLYVRINESLERGRVVGVSFDAYDIQSPQDRVGKLSDHSAVISARKEIGGTCHYFLRNSWGKGCDYQERFSQLCEPEQGGLWITPAMLPSLYYATTVR